MSVRDSPGTRLQEQPLETGRGVPWTIFKCLITRTGDVSPPAILITFNLTQSVLTHTNTLGQRPACRQLPVGALALMLLLALAFGGHAAERILQQDFLLQSWDTEDGLPAGRIRSLARTPDGYLWVATYSGLARFDGVRFVTFNVYQYAGAGRPIASPACWWITTGPLWIGTLAGTLVKPTGRRVCRRGPETIRAANHSDLQPRTRRRRRVVDSCGTGRGVIRLSKTAALRCSTLTADCPQLRFGRWCATPPAGFGRGPTKSSGNFAQGRWQPPAGVPPLPQPVRAIAPSQDGGLWVGILAEHPLGNRGGRILKLKNRQWTDEQEPYPWTRTRSDRR